MTLNDSRGLFFDALWRKSCTIQPCSIKEVVDFVQAHYLRKRPAIVLACLVMMRGGKKLGCIIYSAPPRECETRYGGKTWELARLYLHDEIPKNAETWLIGQSVKWIKHNHPDVQCLVSYADPSAGHKGVIYKAANWQFDGMTDDGRKTPRCDYVDARTGRKYGRKGNMPPDAVVTRIPRISKFRFIFRIRGQKKPLTVTNRQRCINNNDVERSLPIPDRS